MLSDWFRFPGYLHIPAYLETHTASVLSALSVENASNKNGINRATLLLQNRKCFCLVFNLPTNAHWHTWCCAGYLDSDWCNNVIISSLSSLIRCWEKTIMILDFGQGFLFVIKPMCLRFFHMQSCLLEKSDLGLDLVRSWVRLDSNVGITSRIPFVGLYVCWSLNRIQSL